jgi:endonuclease/exonuclease/phosphatase family metal-dependent hydrolase
MEKEDFGIAILSRYPMRLVRAENLPTLPKRKGMERRGAIWVELNVNGTPVQIINTHLGLNGDERMAQVEALLGPDWMKSEKFHAPYVLLGDFNSRPTQPSYKRLAQEAIDATRIVPHPQELRTWHSKIPVFQIDHVFIPKGIHAKAAIVPKTPLTQVASDHLPLIVDLLLPQPPP